MTINKLTDAELRMEIAEALGAEFGMSGGFPSVKWVGRKVVSPTLLRSMDQAGVPDWPNDRDAALGLCVDVVAMYQRHKDKNGARQVVSFKIGVGFARVCIGSRIELWKPCTDSRALSDLAARVLFIIGGSTK